MNPEGYEKIIQKVIGKNKNAIPTDFLVEVFNFIFTFNYFFLFKLLDFHYSQLEQTV